MSKQILLLGEFSTGKSAFINMLLGVSILPERVSSTDLPVVKIHSGKPAGIWLREPNQKNPQALDTWKDISSDWSTFQHAEITIPNHPLLAKDLVIWDTPGINSINEHHKKHLDNFLKTNHRNYQLVYFFVHGNITSTSLEFLKNNKWLLDKLTILVNIKEVKQESECRLLEKEAKKIVRTQLGSIPVELLYIGDVCEEFNELSESKRNGLSEYDLIRNWESRKIELDDLLKKHTVIGDEHFTIIEDIANQSTNAYEKITDSSNIKSNLVDVHFENKPDLLNTLNISQSHHSFDLKKINEIGNIYAKKIVIGNNDTNLVILKEDSTISIRKIVSCEEIKKLIPEKYEKVKNIYSTNSSSLIGTISNIRIALYSILEMENVFTQPLFGKDQMNFPPSENPSNYSESLLLTLIKIGVEISKGNSSKNYSEKYIPSFSADLNLLAYGVKNGFEIIKVFERKIACTCDHFFFQNHVLLSPDSKYAITRSLQEDIINVWDISTNTVISKMPYSQNYEESYLFSPDSQYFVRTSYSYNTTQVRTTVIDIFDVASAKVIARIPYSNVTSNICFLNYSKIISFGDSNGNLIFFDYSQQKQMYMNKIHFGPITSICLDSRNSLICSSGSDRTVKIIEFIK